MSSDRYIDEAIAFYVDSMPSGPLPMTPLGGAGAAGSSVQKTPASGASGATTTAISTSKKNRPQMGISTSTGRDSLGSVASRVLTPLSAAARRNSGGLNVSTEMFFPPDTFGEGVLSPVGSGVMGITPRESMIHTTAAAGAAAAAAAAAAVAASSSAGTTADAANSSGRGFHGFGLQLPPTPQGHPAYDHSAAATPLTATAGGDHHFKFDTSPPSNAKPVDMASAAATLMSVSGPLHSTSHQPHLHPPNAAGMTIMMPPLQHYHPHHPHHLLHLQSAMPTPVKSSESKRPEQQLTCPTPEMSDAVSTQACYPHNPPSQAAAKCYQGEDMATMMHAEVPQYQHIVNYPTFVVQPGRKRKRKKGDKEPPTGAAADGTKRGCVMCGRYCLKSSNKKGSIGGQGYDIAEENRAINTAGPQGQRVIIPNQNKGICTACDVTVWIHAATGLQIKWCKGCKNFKTWAGFGHKGHLTKCMRCRDEQNKRYARQKADKSQKKRLRVEEIANYDAI